MSLAGRVTVSVLTHNRAPELAVTLGHILAGCDGAPVIVVDNASTDATARTLKGLSPRVRSITLPENRGAAGRNAGVLAATTPYVALCDDDTWWSPGSLHAAAAALDAHASVAVVTARVLVGPSEREDATCALMARSPLPGGDLPGARVLGFLAGASMVRRSAFLAAGGFEPRFFLGGEEQLLAVDLESLGWKMVYLPEATVHHHPSAARDAAARRVLLARNELWFSWLRRPWASALSATAGVLRRAPFDRAVAEGAVRAAAGLVWVLRQRRPVPAELERAICLIEARSPPGEAAAAARGRAARRGE
jgi:GT2 family glycosyltransferase